MNCPNTTPPLDSSAAAACRAPVSARDGLARAGAGFVNLLSATEAAAAIAAGTLTSEKLVAACLERVRAREGEVQAWAHIDPDAANSAGFPRPILHGLCTYAIACRAVLQACCDNDPARIAQFDARLSAPLFPGEAIATRIWRNGQNISFECLAAERGEHVIRNGLCVLRD